VASILGVGSTGARAALEQASAKVPKSAARTTVSFIGLGCNYLSILVNHHTVYFLKLLAILNQQPQRLIRKMLQWPAGDIMGYV
jgi:hypothetical protein